jgi:hypothetical protein
MPTGTGTDGEWKADGVEPSRGRFVRLPFERLKQGGTFLGVLSPKLVEECLSLPTFELRGAWRCRRGAKMWGRALSALSRVGALLAVVRVVGLSLRPPTSMRGK